MEYTATLLIDQKASLGEGPSWDAVNHQLLWVDIEEKKVFLYDPKNGTNRTIQLDQYVGAIVPRVSGGAVAALQNGFYAMDLDIGVLTQIINPEKDIPGNRFNDGKCDPAGRFWAGSMSTGDIFSPGSLYCLDTDMSCKKMLTDITTSNGIAFSPDNNIMYYIDSPTKEVAAFNYNLSTAEITNKRVVVTLPEGGGIPDGMTIDSNGMLWVAQWGGYQISHWNPYTGELLGTIPIPAALVTSCVFGGDNLDELYITTARVDLSDEDLAKQPYAGGLFISKPGVKGLKTFSFGG